MLRIEVVTVCVDYADFLSVTAPVNRGLFDRWVVVTTERDEATREVCRRYNLETVLTEDFHKDGPGFSKARGINRGLETLSAACWRLHLDADVILPNVLHQLLTAAELQEDIIYGCDRVMIKGWSEWTKFRDSRFQWHDWHYRLSCPPYPVGTRWVSPHYGYVPIGFFQLWHSGADQYRGVRHRRYPELHNNAARCDVQFGLLWDRPKRALLPEVFAAHLESGDVAMGANWKGRTTAPFGPPAVNGVTLPITGSQSVRGKPYT